MTDITSTTTISAELSQKDATRRNAYAGLLSFYNGEQWLSKTRRGRKKQLTFNYAKLFIDKLTSYLMHDMKIVAIPKDVENEAQVKRAELAQQALDLVSVQNALPVLDYETEIDTAILGDGCYKVIMQDNQVVITTPDVQGIFAWWQPDNLWRLYKVASLYELSGDAVAEYYSFTTAKKTVTAIEVWTRNWFELYIDDVVVRSFINPYGFIPFIVFPNTRKPKEFWGRSDIPDLKEIQEELNRAFSQLSLILELSGNPIAVLENIESAEDIAVEPGAVWELPEKAKAYLLDLLQGGGVKLHVDYIDLLYRVMHDLGESPKAAYGRTERDLSGIALEMELQPLLQKARRKRLIRSIVYERRAAMILELLKAHKGLDIADVTPAIRWGDLLPIDEARTVDQETRLIQAGVHSRETAMILLGVNDPDAEFTKWLEERRRIMTMNRDLNVKARGAERESERPGQSV